MGSGTLLRGLASHGQLDLKVAVLLPGAVGVPYPL